MKSLLLFSASVIAFGLLSACTQGGSTPSLQGNSTPTQANVLPDDNQRNASMNASTMISPATH
jgi:hypothetical protein